MGFGLDLGAKVGPTGIEHLMLIKQAIHQFVYVVFDNHVLQTMGRNLSAPVITITDHYITQW